MPVIEDVVSGERETHVICSPNFAEYEPLRGVDPNERNRRGSHVSPTEETHDD